MATGQKLEDAVPASHWRAAVRQLAVTPEKQQQLRVVFEQFARRRQQLRAQQSSLCGELADETALKVQALSISASDARAGSSSQLGGITSSSTCETQHVQRKKQQILALLPCQLQKARCALCRATCGG
jgi:hypothetical protein